MVKFEKGVRVMSYALLYVSMVTLLFMLFLTIVDVLGRYILKSPIIGTTEIVEMVLPGIVLMSLPYTQQVKGHVMVDLFIQMLPIKPKNMLGIVTTIWAFTLFCLIGWQGIMTVILYAQSGALITNIGVPMYIPRICTPMGAFGICLVLLVDLMHLFANGRVK